MPEPVRPDTENSEFFDALKKGLVLGAALLLLIVPPLRMHQAQQQEQQVAASRSAAAPKADAGQTASPPEAANAPQDAPQDAPAAAPSGADSAQADAEQGGTASPTARKQPRPGLRLADFRGEQPSADARQVADWVVFTGNNKRHAFVLVDKKDARVYVFDPDGRLKESAPALLGSARGDDSFPGIGDKPLSQVRAEEKTTPAGRFVAEPGHNANNEDIVWVDYDAAVSMHRIRPLVAKERRLERLATLTTDDNRISFGCINLPVSFYEDVLSPTVQKLGAIVYVLPEVKSPQQVFGSFDVTDARQVAAWRQATVRPANRGVQKVSLQPSDR
jgi:hypothetical protein